MTQAENEYAYAYQLGYDDAIANRPYNYANGDLAGYHTGFANGKADQKHNQTHGKGEWCNAAKLKPKTDRIETETDSKKSNHHNNLKG